MELLPVQLLCLLVLMNRYVLGPFLRRVRGEAVDRKDPSLEPTVAIIVPLYNEGEGIYRTVLSLAQQDYPREKLEVVVVDDCSTDDSYAWAARAAQVDRRIALLRNPENMGKRKAINRAVLATSAEIVVSVDSDVIADPRAVRQLVARFVSPEIAAVGGRTFVQGQGRNWLTRMVAVKFFFSQEWLKELERVFCTVMCLTGCLTAYRRKVLLELHDVLEDRNIAGVAIKYGEDRFLTRQIVKAGYKTVLTLDAFCTTVAPDTLAGYVQWRAYGSLTIIVAVWALLAATGAIRNEEQRGLLETWLAAGVGRIRLVAARFTAFAVAATGALALATLGALLGRFVHERRLRAYFLIVALTLTFFVGASRVYLGVHYPTDVVAGWSAGLAWALSCSLAARWLRQRRAIEQVDK